MHYFGPVAVTPRGTPEMTSKHAIRRYRDGFEALVSNESACQHRNRCTRPAGGRFRVFRNFSIFAACGVATGEVALSSG